MYKKWFIFVLILLNLSFISAAHSTNYTIVAEKVLVEMEFDKVSNLKLEIPYDASALEVNAPYTIGESGSYNTIDVTYAENLKIKYLSKSFIDKSKDSTFFIARNKVDESCSVTLYLPEGAILTEPRLVSPAEDELITDGHRVILKWNELIDTQIVVSYGFVKSDIFALYLIIIFLIIYIIAFTLLNKIKLRKKEKKAKKEKKIKKSEESNVEDLTKNLFDDEKKIVEYLSKKKGKECWTKELVKDLDISKVKLSRKIRSLEQKELIKRIPYGNENRIRLIS
ncbi:MAG: hypothetical protein ABIB79_00515 [archaeon]